MRKALATFVFLLAFGSCEDEGGDGCSGGDSTCCKVCKDSKPCGDSCISRNETCTKTGGCACVSGEEP